ncbi:hypothetical protein BGZ54_001094, partial [Gamsiella multidivaricata]
LESKIADHPELFTSCSSIRETLGLFLFCHHLLDAPSAVLENDAQLVEAAFGRIKLFGSAARTVLDEPLALKATINYLQEKDPSLVAAAERSMLHSDNPSVHGNMWETLMPPIFVETFKDRPLSGGDDCWIRRSATKTRHPQRHVEFLDTLKRPKRLSEEQQPEATKKVKVGKQA